ncbi:MAG: ester cyclase [Gaiellaceae bacterium]
MAIRRRRERSLPGRVNAAAAALALVSGAIALWRFRRSSTRRERSDRMAENAKASRRIIEEIFGAGNYELAHELVAAGAVGHDPAQPEPTIGPEGLIEGARGYRAAFPDLRLTVDQVLADGDHVAVRWTARGTHKGELFGIPPTSKEATVTGITIDRWADGKLAESWTNWDTLGLLQQLGVVPAAMQPA